VQLEEMKGVGDEVSGMSVSVGAKKYEGSSQDILTGLGEW